MSQRDDRLDDEGLIEISTSRSSAVNHPSHYNMGRIEVISAIEDWGLGFSLGNCVKYVARAGRKSPNPAIEIEDLEKARWYLDRHIQNKKLQQKKKETGRNGES